MQTISSVCITINLSVFSCPIIAPLVLRPKAVSKNSKGHGTLVNHEMQNLAPNLCFGITFGH